MPKSDSHSAVVGGCFILPAAMMRPVANGTTWTAAAAAGATAATDIGATAATPAPSAAIAVTTAPRTRTSARDLPIPGLHFAAFVRTVTSRARGGPRHI